MCALFGTWMERQHRTAAPWRGVSALHTVIMLQRREGGSLRTCLQHGSHMLTGLSSVVEHQQGGVGPLLCIGFS